MRRHGWIAATAILLMIGMMAWATVAPVPAQETSRTDTVELDVTINGQEQVLELDPDDGPVQGVITDRTVILEGIVAVRGAGDWYVTEEPFVYTVGPTSPLYDLKEGGSWVIVPSIDPEAEEPNG